MLLNNGYSERVQIPFLIATIGAVTNISKSSLLKHCDDGWNLIGVVYVQFMNSLLTAHTFCKNLEINCLLVVKLQIDCNQTN